MTSTAALIIAATLFFIAWQQRRHEREMAQLVERVSRPPVYFVPTPAPQAPPERPLMYADLFQEEAEPFELERPRAWGTYQEIAPTRVMRPSIHPRFESYGVDVSFAPTIAVD